MPMRVVCSLVPEWVSLKVRKGDSNQAKASERWLSGNSCMG
jgi:hypothetical protein